MVPPGCGFLGASQLRACSVDMPHQAGWHPPLHSTLSAPSMSTEARLCMAVVSAVSPEPHPQAAVLHMTYPWFPLPNTTPLPRSHRCW